MLSATDRFEIHQLKARYCRFLDTRQWLSLRALFTDDARFDGLGSAPDGASLDDFVRGVSTRLADAVTVHHCQMPELVAEIDGVARGIWSMRDFVQFRPGVAPVEAPLGSGFIGYGYYEERYRREEGVWRIARLRLARQRIDPLPIDHPWPGPVRAAPDPSWLESLSAPVP